jgi:hypothetical protein
MRPSLAVYLSAAVAALSAAAACAQGSLEIIPLRHRTVQQVLPVLRPLLAPGGVLTGRSNQLIVRTNAQNLEQIKSALAAIDTPLRRLLISVRFDDASESRQREIAARGVLQPGGSRVELRAREASAASDERVDQRVQVIEGGRAAIALGQSRPLAGGVLGVQELATGLVVVPRLAGQHVMLEIDPRREMPGAAPGSVDSQRVATTVSGRLGEWIELGGVNSASASETGRPLSSGARGSARSGRVWVKVEEIRP